MQQILPPPLFSSSLPCLIQDGQDRSYIRCMTRVFTDEVRVVAFSFYTSTSNPVIDIIQSDLHDIAAFSPFDQIFN